MNTFFKGVALQKFKQKKKVSFYFSTVDHACVVQLKEDLEVLGHNVYFFGVNHLGLFNTEELIQKLKLEKINGFDSVINFTYINNETGIVWPLSEVIKIKEETNAIVHVDAVQLVGKMANWNELSPFLDGYTFSGHKFGSLKGIGFTFIKQNLEFSPLLIGGNQQLGLRAGTENALGIYSLKLALAEICEHFSAPDLSIAKNEIEHRLIQLIGSKGEVVGFHSPMRNLNTIFIILYEKKAELLSAKFDLMGVDLSTGSACSSGIIKENRILVSMGYGHEDSRSSLRFSFSPLMNLLEAKNYYEIIEKILMSLL